MSDFVQFLPYSHVLANFLQNTHNLMFMLRSIVLSSTAENELLKANRQAKNLPVFTNKSMS